MSHHGAFFFASLLLHGAALCDHPRMLQRALNPHSALHRLLRLVLGCALLAAALHVSLHDLAAADGGLNAHDECQICRLNHVPTIDFAVAAAVLPLLLLAYLLPLVLSAGVAVRHARTGWARAPPLF